MRRRVRPLICGVSVWGLPLLALSLLASAYVVDKVMQAPKTVRITVWFVAAAVLHDVLLFPAYALLDRSLVAAHQKWWLARPPLINHIRVPTAMALLLLLLWLPTITGRGNGTLFAASGLHASGELLRWALLSVAFFGVSGGIYFIRLLRVRRTTEEQS